MLTNEEFTQAARRYIDTVFRVAYNCLKSAADADDVTQNVFLKLLQEKKDFQSQDHIRNWLIRVTINECRDLTRSRWWRRESFEEHASRLAFEDPVHSDLFYAVMDLPKKYRLPIYLHYYEGYTTQEIADLLKLTKSTVCSQLSRGRALIKQSLQEEVSPHVSGRL